MVEIGYALSSEEHRPNDLVKHAKKAEDLGFSFALISDHFHPWLDAQGQSPFVWSVLGGIAQTTRKIRIGTGVTCPILRIHPAIVAHAAATVASMMPGRFFLGVGTGENLNEHVLGDKWPTFDTRLEMLEESIEVMRHLWQGGLKSFEGLYYTVENAQLYTLPEQQVEVYIAAKGKSAATLAGKVGDGFINTEPEREPVEMFEREGGNGKPKIGQMTVCWAKDDASASKTAMKYWKQGGLQGPLSQELAIPKFFEQAAQIVREDDLAEAVICGPDPAKYLEMVQKFVNAGYSHVYIHQVGPDQDGFFNFYQKELQPRLQRELA